MIKTVKLIMVFAACLAVLTFSCFSDFGASDGVLAINLGGGQGERAVSAWPPAESGILELLDFTITLSGPGGDRTYAAKGGDTVKLVVVPGTWTVKIDARCDEYLFGAGTAANVEVKAGQVNQANIIMEKSENEFLIVRSLADWNSLANLSTGDYIIIMDTPGSLIGGGNDINFGSASSVVILGNNTKVTKSTTNGPLLTISGKTVTIKDLHLEGKGVGEVNHDALVLVQGTASYFIMQGSSSISKNRNAHGYGGNGFGGGVRVSAGGTFTMNGGSIFGNEVTFDQSGDPAYGGGVYVSAMEGSSPVSTFIMNDGIIYFNEASNNGGGVFVAGNFQMRGGKIGSDNNSNGSGGGVFMDSGSNFHMAGGTISGNSALHLGGGVYVGGTFSMIGGTIYGINEGENSNVADTDCGAALRLDSPPATAFYGGNMYTSVKSEENTIR